MLLEITDLSLSFQTLYGTMPVLDRVSLSIEPGEIVGIVGESGSGKSVTAQSVLRLLDRNATYTGGSIRFKGQDVLGMKEKEIQGLRGKKIGMVFQEPMTALNPTMRIGKQLANVIRKHQGVTQAEADRLAVEALAAVQMKDPQKVFRQYPHELSGGMRQRVVVALAMSSPPELLIADEPTTALDVTVQAEVLKLMKELSTQTGTSVMLITHDIGVVANMCDRVYVMYGGTVVESGKTEEVLFHSNHPYTRALIEALPEGKPKSQPLKVIEGESFNARKRPVGCVFWDRCPKRTARCQEKPPVVEGLNGHRIACWEGKR
ncbi:ABC transporter ATP-binding protein [Brevibacillus invocatus]|uniref:ABC transporter ATP-binding protein n=1 Tax=Brevibacillus invocatus TaxID=173959 RepID=UPI002040FCC6|nr:ABC transporter ATP-binding protein [Brevibacillus invocatus]MCM3081476.1 ABC transporter ATP-binding protein [Brevibacillus invocatus]MCM3431851.1 ABC transporter ATP-binding protein [Brevibacillus invocatus]